MKVKNLKLVLLVILLTTGYHINAETCISTSVGGNWHLEATWQNGIIPTATDDVVISSGAEVTVYNSDHEVNDVLIESGAVLNGRINIGRTLIVHGGIINNGTIENNGSVFTIFLEGDFTNNGDASLHMLRFTGNDDRNLVFGAGAKFSGSNFQAADTAGTVHVGSDLIFSDTDVNFNFVELEGNGFTIKMEQDGFFDDIHVSNFTIAGKTTIYAGVSFSGDIIVQDSLFKPNNHNIDLYIDGNLTNNGVIYKSNYTFNIFITGNIVNNGEWETSKIHFTGTTTQTISAGTGNSYAASGLEDDDISSGIEALTDLTFNNTIIDLNGGNLEFVAANTLTMNDGTLKDGTLVLNTGTIFMENDADLGTDITISDVTFDGIVLLDDSGIVLEGEIINNAYFRNRHNHNITSTINGNITNNDTITDPNYTLVLYVTGNIVNNGLWSNHTTIFSGATAHSITQGAIGEFKGANFQAEAGTGIITALTDLDFTNTIIDLNGGTLNMPISKGGTLSIYNGTLQDGTLNGNSGILFLEDDGDLGVNLNVSNITLDGIVQIHASSIVLTGEIINNAYLRNYNNNSETLTIEGDITNNDTITDPNYSLTIDITGNITNNGVWSNETTKLTGTGTHEIVQGSGARFSGSYFTTSSGTGVSIALSDLTFYKTDINLNDCELLMEEGNRLSISGISGNIGVLSNGTIGGESFELEGSIYARFQDMEFDADVKTFGQLKSYGIHNHFLQSLSVQDTLTSYTNNYSSIQVDGRIVNNGLIKEANYGFQLKCKEHIINNGEWINYQTVLNGTNDQLIYLIAGKEINGEFRFESDIDDPPYQWKHNGVDINSGDFSGENSATLIWNVPVSTTYWGYFGCQGASDTTRNILIRSGIIIDPVIQLQGPYNGVDMDTDLAEQGLIPLQQPFNVAPWNYAGDEEVASVPNNIVDWVLVELRETAGGPETATEATTVMRRALLLRNDGRVVDPWNQTPEMKYDIDLNDNIYMVVWHRNHLGVMTAVPISDGDSPAYYDFSESSDKAYGTTDALMDMGNGVFGMMGGDADYNQQITQQDLNGFWTPNVGSPIGYDAADFTLDGQIDNQDKNQTWAKTLGKMTQVPE